MKYTKWLVVAVSVTLSMTTQAHRAWFLPAATVLSGEEPWVTVDGAVSNDIFYTDHAAMSLNSLEVYGPDGNLVEVQNQNTGKYRSTFDLQLLTEGTYKIGTASIGLNARWVTAEGERGSWPGRRRAASQATEFDAATMVPEGATDLTVSMSSRRIETFVTAGTPTETVFELTNKGLEMQPITHPNDLFDGETARFRMLIDGEPAVGAEVTVVPDGIRYRYSQNDQVLETDAEGVVAIDWTGAGLYWVEVSYQDDKAQGQATSRSGTYVMTLEVLPE